MRLNAEAGSTSGNPGMIQGAEDGHGLKRCTQWAREYRTVRERQARGPVGGDMRKE